MKKNIGINAVLNAIRQLLSVIFPLITFPYALRVLGVSNIGKVNYSNSIVTYFALFAALGISTYAVREGAKFRDDKDELNKFANEIFTINLIATVLSYFVLVIFLVLNKSLYDYTVLILIQSATILFTTMGVDWINSIFEDYLYITVRSIITYVISIILLFALVHSQEDYILYAVIQVITSAVICISNLCYCRKYISIKLTKRVNTKKHIAPIMILFANNFAISIYVNFDITMLGWWKGDSDVGYYTAATKVYIVVKNLLMTIYQVTIPRLSYYFGEKNYKEYKDLFSQLWGKLTVLLIPVAIGLCVLAPEIMLLIGGKTYVQSSGALRILCGALVFSIYAGFVSPVLNVTIGREKENLYATTISAFVNFFLNFYFIKRYSFMGAAFTTMISEIIAFVFPLVRIENLKKYLDVKNVKNSFFKVLLSGISILLIYNGIKYITSYYLLIIFGTIILSIPMYALFLYLLKDEYFMDILRYVRVIILRIQEKIRCERDC